MECFKTLYTRNHKFIIVYNYGFEMSPILPRATGVDTRRAIEQINHCSLHSYSSSSVAQVDAARSKRNADKRERPRE